jgi:hypothetical protein
MYRKIAAKPKSRRHGGNAGKFIENLGFRGGFQDKDVPAGGLP